MYKYTPSTTFTCICEFRYRKVSVWPVRRTKKTRPSRVRIRSGGLGLLLLTVHVLRQSFEPPVVVSLHNGRDHLNYRYSEWRPGDPRRGWGPWWVGRTGPTGLSPTSYSPKNTGSGTPVPGSPTETERDVCKKFRL